MVSARLTGLRRTRNSSAFVRSVWPRSDRRPSSPQSPTTNTTPATTPLRRGCCRVKQAVAAAEKPRQAKDFLTCPELPASTCRKFSSPPCRPVLLMASAIVATINTELHHAKTEIQSPSRLLAIEKVLTLLRSVHTLEGTDKDGVEHLLEMAVENLKKMKSPLSLCRGRMFPFASNRHGHWHARPAYRFPCGTHTRTDSAGC